METLSVGETVPEVSLRLGGGTHSLTHCAVCVVWHFNTWRCGRTAADGADLWAEQYQVPRQNVTLFAGSHFIRPNKDTNQSGCYSLTGQWHRNSVELLLWLACTCKCNFLFSNKIGKDHFDLAKILKPGCNSRVMQTFTRPVSRMCF